MKWYIKSFSFVFAIVLILNMVSCKENQQSGLEDTDQGAVLETNTDIEEETIDREYPNLPEVEYSGYDYNIFAFELGGRYMDLVPVEDTSTAINDAVYRRNLTIEEKYGISINATYEPYITMATKYSDFVAAGEKYYNLAVIRGGEIPVVFNSGVCRNLYDLEYLDFSKPWWDSNCTDQFTIKNVMYIASSDLTLNDKADTGCVYFNKTVYENQLVNSYGSLYDIVNDGKWTLDKLLQMSNSVKNDLNGNGTVDNDDVFGITSFPDAPVQMLAGGAARIVETDESGIPVSSFKSERNFDLLKKAVEMVYTEDMYNNLNYSGANPGTLLSENRVLFYITSLIALEGLRSLDVELGIVPTPKYTEEQDSYYSNVYLTGSSFITVPKTVEDLDYTGIILEALSAESRYTLILDAYYETALKGKYARDQESQPMLDIILSNRSHDIGIYLATGGFYYAIFDMSYNNDSNVASRFAQCEQMITTDIENLIKMVESNG